MAAPYPRRPATATHPGRGSIHVFAPTDPSMPSGSPPDTRHARLMSRRPRVMYLSTSSGAGGAERQVHDLAIRMAGLGWDVTAVSMLPLDVTFDGLPEKGVATMSLGMRKGRPDPRSLVRLGRLLRDRRPDVLHAHMVHAILLARISRLVWPAPVVVSTMHNQYQGARWRMLAYRLTDRLTDATTSVSEVAMRDTIRQGAVAPDRIAAVPNGIVLERHDPDDRVRARVRSELGAANQFLWLAAGRLTRAKDYPNLIEAFRRLASTGERSRLLIAGGGPDEASIRECVTAAGVDGRATLLGVRPDVPDLMRAADAFVLSSAWEGLPMVLLEAGASSLPIVTTDVGGNREAVLDGQTGFVVPARDAGALAEGMRRVAEMEPADRLAMGRAARAHTAAHFDIDVIARRWHETYLDLLGRRGAAGRSRRSG